VARILIVDDEPDLRFLMAKYLEADGHEVDQASNGANGLEMLRQQAYDLVVTDNVMPVMGGPEFIGAIRNDPLLSDLLIVAWSVNPDQQLPVEAVFAKPYGGQEIRDRINELLAEDS
jgi:CheY-like chemotaxis protein